MTFDYLKGGESVYRLYMLLSKRLHTIVKLIEGNTVADVGTDHAYIPIYLIKNKLANKVIAMDINKGPLERANENILLNNCQCNIETRLSDGLNELKSCEADSIVIAGMGGLLIIKILTEGKEKLHGISQLILQPQSEIHLVRRYLHKEGYSIALEEMIIDDDKFYTIIKAIKGHEIYNREIDYRYGKVLLDKKSDILKEFLLNEDKQYRKLYYNLCENNSDDIGTRIKERINEIEEELNLIKEGLVYYEK